MLLNFLMLILCDLPESEKSWLNEQECIAEHLMRLLPQGNKLGLRGRCSKIVVHVARAPARVKTLYCQGVCERYIQGDPWEITQETDPIRRKEWYLRHLLQGVLLVAEEEGWDKRLFLDAAAQIRAGGYVNRWVWGKPLSNPARSHKVVAECNHDWDVFTLTLRIMDKQGRVVIAKEVIRCAPTVFSYTQKLGKLRWADDRTIQVLSWNQKIVAELTV
ncbi:MAG: hypothetical protein WCJ97_10140 [Phycisphaerae bacterium]